MKYDYFELIKAKEHQSKVIQFSSTSILLSPPSTTIDAFDKISLSSRTAPEVTPFQL